MLLTVASEQRDRPITFKFLSLLRRDLVEINFDIERSSLRHLLVGFMPIKPKDVFLYFYWMLLYGSINFLPTFIDVFTLSVNPLIPEGHLA
tara:strand:+ start:386 stop:658 length:273 start_codon:yes stop_codon:yes gene_type:complete